MELLAISIVLNIALVIVIFIGILYHNFCVSSLIEEIESKISLAFQNTEEETLKNNIGEMNK